MEKFFSKEEDNNMLNVISIDFSKFNSSLVTNMDSLFFGCNSLEYINLEGFDTSNVENMNSMFAQCNSLKILNLSNFVTSKVKFMNYMFYNCTSLNILDISNFNLLQVTSVNQMYNGLFNLIYFNAENLKANNNLDYQFRIENNALLVCQKNNVFGNENMKNVCCSYNYEKRICESSNYITLYYKENINYINGFINNYRNGISFINYNNSTIAVNTPFNIIAETKVEIHFNTPITNMENFFSKEEDNNMLNIISIDFSHFDSSLVTNMNS
jgi:surface protein